MLVYFYNHNVLSFHIKISLVYKGRKDCWFSYVTELAITRKTKTIAFQCQQSEEFFTVKYLGFCPGTGHDRAWKWLRHISLCSFLGGCDRSYSVRNWFNKGSFSLASLLTLMDKWVSVKQCCPHSFSALQISAFQYFHFKLV